MGVITIVSYSGRSFRDRAEAGQLLAQELKKLEAPNPVVLGIPRGGLVVARELARELDGDLDVVLSHKLRTQGESELAMGSLSEDGKVFLNPSVIQTVNVAESYVKHEVQVQSREIDRRRRLIRRVRPKVPLKGRSVILTDDGVATGATAEAALWSVRQERPGTLIAAFPVAAQESLARLAEIADQVICLQLPQFFVAVGQFYATFDQVTDEGVLKILREEFERERARQATGGR